MPSAAFSSEEAQEEPQEISRVIAPPSYDPPSSFPPSSPGFSGQLLARISGQRLASMGIRDSRSVLGGSRRWRSNPSGKCSQERPTWGTVTSTMRKAAHPSGCARCGAGAGCSAKITHLSPWGESGYRSLAPRRRSRHALTTRNRVRYPAEEGRRVQERVPSPECVQAPSLSSCVYGGIL